MIRWILRIVWLALSVVIGIWVYEGLFGVDQRDSLLTFLDSDRETNIIFVGVAWGLCAMFMRFAGSGGRRTGRRSARTHLAVGEVVEASRTGLTVNDVPQYDVIMEVSPAEGERFVSSMRGLYDAATISQLLPGAILPVRYDPEHTDRVDFAAMDEPGVTEAMTDWRVKKGLIRPDLVWARTRGLPHQASVLEMRPTGVQREGNVEIHVTLLVTPESGQAQREVETTAFVRPEALGRVQVGSPVFAMWEPGRPDKVAMTILREEPIR